MCLKTENKAFLHFRGGHFEIQDGRHQKWISICINKITIPQNIHLDTKIMSLSRSLLILCIFQLLQTAILKFKMAANFWQFHIAPQC